MWAHFVFGALLAGIPAIVIYYLVDARWYVDVLIVVALAEIFRLVLKRVWRR